MVIAQRLGEEKCALRLQLPKEVLCMTRSTRLYKANIHQIVRFPDIHRDDLLAARHKGARKTYRIRRHLRAVERSTDRADQRRDCADERRVMDPRGDGELR